MTPVRDRTADGRPPTILCAGFSVLDEIYHVDRLPDPEEKTPAGAFLTVSGGSAANAAVAISRLGGRARLVAPLGGPAGVDEIGDRILASLAGNNVDTNGCIRLSGTQSPISAIIVDRTGEGIIVNFRDARVASVHVENPEALISSADAVVADNRLPRFVLPLCMAARRRGLAVVLDIDKPVLDSTDLMATASHIVFSADGLRGTTGVMDLAEGLTLAGGRTGAFVAVTDGARDALWLDGKTLRRQPAYPVSTVDTVGAGDVFHGAFALSLLEGRTAQEAIQFGAAAAAVKCSRFGGIFGAPARGEVEALL